MTLVQLAPTPTTNALHHASTPHGRRVADARSRVTAWREQTRVKAYLEAFRSCNRTGTFVQVGVPRPQARLELSMTELFRGPIIKPSHYGGCLPTRDFPMLVDLYARDKVDLDALVSQTITLDQVGTAFAPLEGGEVLRSVLVL